MSDNVLKKEFNERDIKRVRDLVKGNNNNSTSVQTGYTKSKFDHIEGEEWEENGKTWTVIDGIKQNVTKLDDFKKLSLIPLLCPSCNNPLSTIYDKKMYRIHNKCLKCVVTFETELKKQGKYKEYAQSMIDGNVKYFLNDYEEFLNDISENMGITDFVSEDGVVEKWIGNNKNVIEEAKKQLRDIKSNMK